jgi:hypothetical protein
MGRQKKPKVVPVDTSNVTPASMTQEIYTPETPTNADGTVAVEAIITPAQAQRIGAVTAGAVARNKRVAKTVARKAAGERDVNWNETDVMALFDMVTQLYPSPSLYAHITQVHPDTFTYPPVKLQGIASSPAFYDYLLRNVHRASGPAKYEIEFKDSTNKQFRGTGHIMMPNTLDDPSLRGAAPMNQPPGYPPSPYYPPGYPQPQAYGQQPYGAQPYAPYQAPQPVAPSPPQAMQAPPAPAPQPPPQAPSPQQYPPQPAAALQGVMDPALVGALGGILNEIRNMQMQNQQRDLQNAHVLGALDEFKRLEATRAYGQPPPQPPQPYAPSPPQQQQAAPPPPQPPPHGLGQPGPSYGAYGQPFPQQAPGYPQYPQQSPPPMQQAFDGQGRPMFDSYGRAVYIPMQPQFQPQQQQQPPRGFGAVPPPPPAPPAPAAAATNGFGDLAGLAGMIAGAVKSLESIKSAVGVGTPGGGDPEEEEDPAAAMVPRDEPFITTRLGFTDNPPVLVTHKDGSVNALGTILGNVGQIPDLFHKIADGIANVQVQANRLGQTRPINAHGVVVEQQHHQRQLPASPPPPPPPAPISITPSIDSLR